MKGSSGQKEAHWITYLDRGGLPPICAREMLVALVLHWLYFKHLEFLWCFTGYTLATSIANGSAPEIALVLHWLYFSDLACIPCMHRNYVSHICNVSHLSMPCTYHMLCQSVAHVCITSTYYIDETHLSITSMYPMYIAHVCIASM